MLLPSTTLNNAVIVAEKILDSIETADSSDEKAIPPATVSLGISLYNDRSGQTSIGESIKSADHALYKSKAKGKNVLSY